MAPVKHLTVYGPWCHCVVSTETCIINLTIVCASMITRNVQKLLLNRFNHLLSMAIKSVVLIAPGNCGWFNWIAGGMWIGCRVCAWNNYLLSSLQIVLKRTQELLQSGTEGRSSSLHAYYACHVWFLLCMSDFIYVHVGLSSNLSSPSPSVVFHIMRKNDYRKRLKAASCFSSLLIFCVLRKRDIACEAHQTTQWKQQSFTNELK